MAKKELKWRGKSLDEMKNVDLKEFILLLPARKRRSSCASSARSS